MLNTATLLLIMAGSVVCMPPPAGLNLKPAKAVGGEQPKVPLVSFRVSFSVWKAIYHATYECCGLTQEPTKSLINLFLRELIYSS